MSLNLAQTVIDYLGSNPDEKFTARDMAKWVFETYPDECKEKRDSSVNKAITSAKTEEAKNTALLNAIVAEIGAQIYYIQKAPGIKTTEGRPRKYYYTSNSDEVEISNAEHAQNTPSGSQKIKEHDLYPKLSQYLWVEFGQSLYSKRINEKKSANQRGPNGNKWLYPDVVSLEDLTHDWEQGVKDCVDEYGDKKARLWSFEVKLLVNRSNVREVYFQAVSNSSWANLGYLVASEIEGVDTMKELRMLSALHGIGFIKLDAENPAESQILIPAAEHDTIDWNTANRLANENQDFRAFIKSIKQFHQTGNPETGKWDLVELNS